MATSVMSSAQSVTPRPAVPVEPIGAIIDAFRSHNVVAVGEPHGNEQGHACRVPLIRDPRFAASVDDIVWECGNARYQDVMDRFIRGEDDPDSSPRQVWAKASHLCLGLCTGKCESCVFCQV
jgi:hypothetical protein